MLRICFLLILMISSICYGQVKPKILACDFATKSINGIVVSSKTYTYIGKNVADIFYEDGRKDYAVMLSAIVFISTTTSITTSNYKLSQDASSIEVVVSTISK